MRPRRGNLALLGASILVGLLIAEIALRIAGISFPEFSRLHPVLGWAPRPGVEGTYAFGGRTHLRINKAGFRDSDHALAKPEGVLRIAVLGDSFTEAREVALEETFWKVMEAEMAGCVPGVEVLGFGVNGYGTAQEYLVLETSVWDYDPDIVLLAVFTGNDVWNNSRRLDGHEYRPYYVFREGALVLDDTNQRSLGFRIARVTSEIKRTIFNRLRTFQVVHQSYRDLKTRRKYGDLEVIDQLGAGLETALYVPPTETAWTEAWAVTEGLILKMRAATEERGADFWIVTLTNPAQVHPDAAIRRQIAETVGMGDDLTYPDRRFGAFAEARGIPFIGLLEPLRAYAEAEGASLHGSVRFAGGHWNSAGHRRAGEVLAERLCAAYASS